MTRTKRQLQRCELARRLLYAKDLVTGRGYVKAELQKVAGPDGECWVPRFGGLRFNWGSRCDLREIEDDAEKDQALIIAVPYKMLASLGRQRGVEILKPDIGHLDPGELRGVLTSLGEHAMQTRLHREGMLLGDFDRWSKPFADRAIGEYSYAHTSLYLTDDFGTDYDPLTDDSNWDWEANMPGYVTAAVYSSSGQAKTKDPGSSSALSVFSHAGTAMSSADYSVELNQWTVDATLRDILMVAARLNGSTFYGFFANRAGSDYVRMIKRLSGSNTILGTTYTTVAYPAVIRLELVGSTLKGYLDGSEELSVSDSSITTAEKAGLYVWNDQNNTTSRAQADDFKVYVEAGGATIPAIMAYYRRRRQ